MSEKLNLVDKITEALPQLQCKKCEYDDCKSYATAIVEKNEHLNKCEPGLKQTENQLKEILEGKQKINLNIIKGYKIAEINENDCIGCTICIKVCPVDAIIGAKMQKHFIIDEQCNGCELCINECPVDCIEMVHNPKNASWIWPSLQAEQSQKDYYNRLKRLETNKTEKRYNRGKTYKKILIETYIEEAVRRENKKYKKLKEYE